MSYREKIEKYKKNLLAEAERIEVEEDIEKVDAISEYLAERLEEELDFGGNTAEADLENEGETDSGDAEGTVKKEKKALGKTKKEEVEFERYVRKAIRRSFTRMAVVVGAVLLAAILFIQFGLSPILDSMYYNPAKQIEILSEDKQSAMIFPQMTMDFDIYRALTRPEIGQGYVMAYPLGYGNYSITLNPSAAYGTGRFNSVGGQIRKGKLELYDPNYLKTESVNVFACYGFDRGADYEAEMEKATKDFEKTGGWSHWRYWSLEDARQRVETLDEDKKYVAYVSLKRDLSFEEMQDLMKRVRRKASKFLSEPWLAVHAEEDNMFGFGHIGHPYNDVSSIRTPEVYNEQYPYLSVWELDAAGNLDWEKMEEIKEDEEIVTQHFISMLDYISDQKEFSDMMEVRVPYVGRLRGAARYVEEHGLSYYGFVCITTKEDMLTMLEEEEIIGIVPKDLD